MDHNQKPSSPECRAPPQIADPAHPRSRVPLGWPGRVSAQLGCPASCLPALGRAGLPRFHVSTALGTECAGTRAEVRVIYWPAQTPVDLTCLGHPTPSGDYVPRTTLATFRFQMCTFRGLWGSSVSDWGPPFCPCKGGDDTSPCTALPVLEEREAATPGSGREGIAVAQAQPRLLRQLPAQVADSAASRLPLPTGGQRVPSAATLPLLAAPSGSCPCPPLQTPGTGTEE